MRGREPEPRWTLYVALVYVALVFVGSLYIVGRLGL